MAKNLFKGFYDDEITKDGYVKTTGRYLMVEWWNMTDRRVGEHTPKNHEVWMQMATEIMEAIRKRNNRAYNKEMDKYIRPFYFHRELLADGYRYNKETDTFIKQ